MKKVPIFLAVVMICTALAAPAPAQPTSTSTNRTRDESPEIRVAVVVIPPFVMEQNGSLTGFNIELWDAIAARLNRRTRYQIEPNVLTLEEAMRSNQVDLTVAPVIVTSARDEDFDFSYPLLSAGMQIMVRGANQKTQTENPLRDMLRLIVSRTTALWLGVALLLATVLAHVIWLLERWRWREDSMISSRKYFPGIFEALYWAVSTLTSQAQSMPTRWLARALSVYWMFVAVVFVAFYTAQLTTSLTVEQIRGAIEGPNDLPGKQVATLTHSLAADYLREHQAQVQEFPTIGQVFQALVDKNVDAIMLNAPILRYYAAHEGKGQVQVVGPEINILPLAIMVQLNSPLRKKIDGALLKLREDGSYERIYEKWFGSE